MFIDLYTILGIVVSLIALSATEYLFWDTYLAYKNNDKKNSLLYSILANICLLGFIYITVLIFV